MSASGGRADAVVAVVSWNTREMLDACLASLRPDVEAGRAEVWVVDNASSDGSIAMVHERHPFAHTIASEENLGFGPAVNLVARRTCSPWIVAANADIALTWGALTALLDAGRWFPRAGAIAPLLRTPGGGVQHSVHPLPTLPRTLAFSLGVHAAWPALGDRLGLHGCWDSSRSRNIDWAHGALLAVRREAWDAAGGFDDGQWMYAEDLDLIWRLREAGWRTRFEPRAEVLHHISAAAKQAFGDDRDARSQAAFYAWMRLRRGRARASAYAAINVAGALAQAAAPRRRPMALRWARLHVAGLRARTATVGLRGHYAGSGLADALLADRAREPR